MNNLMFCAPDIDEVILADFHSGPELVRKSRVIISLDFHNVKWASLAFIKRN